MTDHLVKNLLNPFYLLIIMFDNILLLVFDKLIKYIKWLLIIDKNENSKEIGCYFILIKAANFPFFYANVFSKIADSLK